VCKAGLSARYTVPRQAARQIACWELLVGWPHCTVVLGWDCFVEKARASFFVYVRHTVGGESAGSKLSLEKTRSSCTCGLPGRRHLSGDGDVWLCGTPANRTKRRSGKPPQQSGEACLSLGGHGCGKHIPYHSRSPGFHLFYSQELHHQQPPPPPFPPQVEQSTLKNGRRWGCLLVKWKLKWITTTNPSFPFFLRV